MDLREAVLDYGLFCQSKNLSKETWRWYEYKLRFFREWAEAQGITDVEDIETRTIQHFVASLKNGTSYRGDGKERSSYTNKGYVQVIKGFLHWAEEEGMIGDEVCRKVKLPKVSKRIIRTYTPDHIARMEEAANNETLMWLRTRDKAILQLLLDTGIRASELCGLQRADVCLDPSDPHIVVIGKGDKERPIGPLSPETQRLLRRYLRQCPAKRDELFVSTRHTPLTPNGLDKLLARLERWAGPQHFAGIRVSAHTFRHTYAVTKLRQGMDLVRISILMGHSSLTVTENYLRDFQVQEARFLPVSQQPGRR